MSLFCLACLLSVAFDLLVSMLEPRDTPNSAKGPEAAVNAPRIPPPSPGAPNISAPVAAILKKSPTDKPWILYLEVLVYIGSRAFNIQHHQPDLSWSV